MKKIPLKAIFSSGTTVAVKKSTEIEEHNTEYVVHERKATTNIGLQNSKGMKNIYIIYNKLASLQHLHFY